MTHQSDSLPTLGLIESFYCGCTFAPSCPLKSFIYSIVFFLPLCCPQRASGDCNPALKLPGLGLVRRPNLESLTEETYLLLAKLALASLAYDRQWHVVHIHFLFCQSATNTGLLIVVGFRHPHKNRTFVFLALSGAMCHIQQGALIDTRRVAVISVAIFSVC